MWPTRAEKRKAPRVSEDAQYQGAVGQRSVVLPNLQRKRKRICLQWSRRAVPFLTSPMGFNITHFRSVSTI
ncbi:hypothetical protein PsorP6_012289 [Peronosclerospora sorghi]|uniref:Uncharacterized protein n=1 Tax=Peronosclerospora sorghi TaxID=230839 RepID=A0ACC0WJ76_9STRA|nr:hypothetical protein PsorP6_012289 [Peronosclerospora sorghi]